MWGYCGDQKIIHMASLSFRIKSKSKIAPILVRFRPTREIEFSASTKFEIDPEHWDTITGLPYDKKKSLRGLTSNLWELKKTILKKYDEDLGIKKIDKNWLNSVINEKPIIEVKESLIPEELVAYFDYYLEIRKVELGYRSCQKYNVIKNNIIQFQDITGKVVKISDVGFKFAETFKSIMIGQGYAPNTVERGVTFIKTVCKHANRHGLKLKNDFLDISTKNHKVTWPYLTLEELGKIRIYTFDKDYLQNAADWLIISCFTGQRVSDFMRFRKEMIFEEQMEHGTIKMIDITQDKTKAQVYIPILPHVQSILDKRNGEFPRAISDQKYNTYIKEVCKIVGINQTISGTKKSAITGKNESGEFAKFELVSSHIGRRSFATNFYTSGGFDLRDIMEITGHTSERTFLLYIGKKKKSGARSFFSSYAQNII